MTFIDLRLVGISGTTDPTLDYLHLDEEKYDYKELFSYGASNVAVIKYPYLRRSYGTKRKVTETLMDYMLETAVLAFAAIIIASFFGILFGVLSALNKDSFLDRSLLFTSVLGMSVPSFYSAIIFSWFFSSSPLQIAYLQNCELLQ